MELVEFSPEELIVLFHKPLPTSVAQFAATLGRAYDIRKQYGR
jgi:hypothetical protein